MTLSTKKRARARERDEGSSKTTRSESAAKRVAAYGSGALPEHMGTAAVVLFAMAMITSSCSSRAAVQTDRHLHERTCTFVDKLEAHLRWTQPKDADGLLDAMGQIWVCRANNRSTKQVTGRHGFERLSDRGVQNKVTALRRELAGGPGRTALHGALLGAERVHDDPLTRAVLELSGKYAIGRARSAYVPPLPPGEACGECDDDDGVGHTHSAAIAQHVHSTLVGGLATRLAAESAEEALRAVWEARATGSPLESISSPLLGAQRWRRSRTLRWHYDAAAKVRDTGRGG